MVTGHATDHDRDDPPKHFIASQRQTLNFEGKSEVDAGPSGRGECGGKGSDLKALPQDHRGSTWIHSLVGRLCHSDSESDSLDLERFDTWMKLYLASLPTVDHEYLKHHLGCIFAVSTTTKYAS